MSEEKLDKTIQSSQLLISETVAAVLNHKTMEEAASNLGITRAALYDRFNRHPEIRKGIDLVKERATTIITKSTEKAAETLISGLDDRHYKYEAAKEILNRSGIGINKNDNTTNIQINVTPIYGGKSSEE